MKVSRGKQCFNTQCAHMSSVLSPDHQVLLILLSWSCNYPSMAPFQSPIQVNSTSIEQNVSIQKSLSVAFSLENDCDFLHSNRASTWHYSRRKLHKLFYQLFYLKKTATVFTELLQGIYNLNSNLVQSALTDIVEDHHVLWNIQGSFAEQICANCKFHA